MQERQYDLSQVRALANNMTQQQAADLLGIHRNTYIMLERTPGKLQLTQAYILAEAAGISIEQIKR